MRPPKGTKGRKPKPRSKGGQRAKQAEESRRRAAKKRAGQPRQAQRKAKGKAKSKTGSKIEPRDKLGAGYALTKPGLRPSQRLGRVGRIKREESSGAEPGTEQRTDPAAGQRVRPRLDATLPIVAIVGRPNVGKSTLFNRLTHSRRSIVGDEPGITRDRIYGEVEWLGRRAIVVDTGGILPQDQSLIPAEILRQARVAIAEAAFLVMVADGRAPLTAPDYDLAHLLFESGKPVLLAVNKMDTRPLEEQTAEVHRLGIRDVLPISAEHGIGMADLLDHVFASIGAPPAEGMQIAETEAEVETAGIEEASGEASRPSHGGYRRRETSIAIIGRPNVGKSTLLNALTGSSRAIVSPVPGTTRDAVDEVIEVHGARLRFIDTAGIRRKGKTRQMTEKLSVVMARRHLEAADIALLILDATEGVTSSDATIGGYAHESGRSVILVVNKWDLVTTGRNDGKPPADRAIFERQLRNVLKYLAYAPVIFVSAAEGKNMDGLLELVLKIAAERRKRVSTAQMNRFLERVDFDRASVPMANQMRILYMTQAAVAPPTFILFTNRQVKLHFSFQRFLENRIRAAFSFQGSPIWFRVRPRREKQAG